MYANSKNRQDLIEHSLGVAIFSRIAAEKLNVKNKLFENMYTFLISVYSFPRIHGG